MGWQQQRRKKSLVLVGHYRTLCGPVNKTRVDLSYCNRNSNSNHPSDLTNKNFEKNQHLPSAFDWYSSFKGSSQTNSTLSNLIMKKRLPLHRDIQEFDLKMQLLPKSLGKPSFKKNSDFMKNFHHFMKVFIKSEFFLKDGFPYNAHPYLGSDRFDQKFFRSMGW